MASQALFEGLVIDENGNFVEVAHVGNEAYYVVDDNGFKRHVESEYVDRQVLETFLETIEGHKDQISEGTMKMLGQEDIFTKAAIDSSLENLDEYTDQLLRQGLPLDLRNYLGMVGFRVRIDIHGDVLEIEQPSIPEDPFE